MDENIFDLSPEAFQAAIAELRAMGYDTDDLTRQYRSANSPFASINSAADNFQQGLADEGRRSVLGGLLSKVEGSTGMDAIRGLNFEGLGGLLGAGQAVGRAIDAPGAAYQGLIPRGDMAGEALNVAGMAMGAGGAATAPGGALRAGSARAGRVTSEMTNDYEIFRYNQNDRVVGELWKDRETGLVEYAEVDPELRRQGIGTELYDAAGITSPSSILSDDALAFWSSRQPQANASQSGGLLGAGLSEAQRQARDILDMRAAGRAGDVTDDMMARADPQYMYDNTPLPMDEASRLARAQASGFDTGTPLYHGTKTDISSIDPRAVLDGNARGRGFYMTDNPASASGYATGADMNRIDLTPGNQPNVTPLLSRSNFFNERQVVPRAELRRLQGIEDQILTEAGDARHTASAQGLPELDSNLRFDRAYPATGANVRYNLFNPELTLNRAGYEGQSGPAVVGSGSDFVTTNPTAVRSQFARFDPEFSHLSNLSAVNASPAGLLAMQPEQETRPLPFMEMLRGLLR
jgi:GNAT superfamily N-acetyltransferase